MPPRKTTVKKAPRKRAVKTGLLVKKGKKTVTKRRGGDYGDRAALATTGALLGTAAIAAANPNYPYGAYPPPPYGPYGPYDSPYGPYPYAPVVAPYYGYGYPGYYGWGGHGHGGDHGHGHGGHH